MPEGKYFFFIIVEPKLEENLPKMVDHTVLMESLIFLLQIKYICTSSCSIEERIFSTDSADT